MLCEVIVILVLPNGIFYCNDVVMFCFTVMALFFSDNIVAFCSFVLPPRICDINDCKLGINITV